MRGSPTGSTSLGRPFLRILRDIVRAGDRNETSVTLCGEMASKPLSAMALLGIGYRSVSMSPTAVGPVKAMLLALDVDKLSAMLHAALDDTRARRRCARCCGIRGDWRAMRSEVACLATPTSEIPCIEPLLSGKEIPPCGGIQ